MRQEKRWASKAVIGPMPLLPARTPCQVASVPMPTEDSKPTPVTTTLRDKQILLGKTRRRYFLADLFSIYETASLTVAIFSASSSGISSSKASSKAMTSSTMSSESAPRSSTNDALSSTWASSTNDALSSTWASSTPSCSTIICFTLSAIDAIHPPGLFETPDSSRLRYIPQVRKNGITEPQMDTDAHG